MEFVLRAIVIYVFLMIVIRVAGRRTMASMTAFDFVILLIISEAVQNAMVDDDKSLTSGFLVITTLIMTNVAMSWLKMRFPAVEKWMDGKPVVLVADGSLLQDRAHRARVDEEDILQEARQNHGISRMQEIKYAVLEANGGISIIPQKQT